MKALILQQPGSFAFVEQAKPREPADGEALVRVHTVGLCGTDLHAYAGRQPFFHYPRILGHELGVEIAEVGENPHGLAIGDRCVVEPYLNCGHCIACRRSRPNACANIQVMGVHVDGGMREYLRVPLDKLHRSRVLSWEELPLIETLAIGAHAVTRAELEPGENVLVIGAGPIGLSVIAAARGAGAHVLVMELNAGRREWCRQYLGIVSFVEPSDDAVARLSEQTAGDLATAVFDATGNPQSMMKALHYMAPGGRLVFVGFSGAALTFDNPEFHKRETTLLASRNAISDDFERCIATVEEKRIDITSWVTHRANLEELPEALPLWLAPTSGLLKAVVYLTHAAA